MEDAVVGIRSASNALTSSFNECSPQTCRLSCLIRLIKEITFQRDRSRITYVQVVETALKTVPVRITLSYGDHIKPSCMGAQYIARVVLVDTKTRPLVLDHELKQVGVQSAGSCSTSTTRPRARQIQHIDPPYVEFFPRLKSVGRESLAGAQAALTVILGPARLDGTAPLDGKTVVIISQVGIEIVVINITLLRPLSSTHTAKKSDFFCHSARSAKHCTNATHPLDCFVHGPKRSIRKQKACKKKWGSRASSPEHKKWS